MTMDIDSVPASGSQDQPMSDSSPSVWHTGSPAEAISIAITQQKLFLVSIQPTSESSPSSWDTIWTNEEIRDKLLENAVCLKMDQGTTDAAMFLQLVGFPVEASGVWIVFAGRLLDSFGMEQVPSVEEMLRRIQGTIIQAEEIKAQPNVSIPAPAPATVPGPQQQSPSVPSVPSTSPPQSIQQSQTSPAIQSQLAARRAKLEAAKAQHDKEVKEARKAAAARQSSSTDPERQKYISQQAKERAQQKAQRERILAEIENDKAERKARAEREKRAQAGIPDTPQSTTSNSTTTRQSSSNGGMANGMTRLSIRQPDSKTLKTEFSAEKTLAEVRKWIDSNRTDGTSPYVLQTTFPTRTFEVSEEESETVGTVFGKGGQCIMKEIKQFSEAYSANPPGVVSLASSLLGSVTGTLSSVLFGPSTTTTPSTSTVPTSSSTSPLPGAFGSSGGTSRPGEAIREARIRNVNYSARERGVTSGRDEEGEGRERNWFNGNGLAQEAPPRDPEKRD